MSKPTAIDTSRSESGESLDHLTLEDLYNRARDDDVFRIFTDGFRDKADLREFIESVPSSPNDRRQ